MTIGKRATRHFVLGVAGVFIAAIVAIALISGFLLREREVETWRHQLENLSLVLAEHTLQSMASAEFAMESIVEEIDELGIRDATELRAKAQTAFMHRTLLAKIVALSHVEVISLVAANGDIIADTRGFPAPALNIAARDDFAAQREGTGTGVFVSLPVQDKGRWRFYLSRRLDDAHGKFLGMVTAAISVEQLSDFYWRLGRNLGEGATITLLRRDFSLLARWPSREDLIGQKNLIGSSHRVVEQMKKTEGVVYMTGPRFSDAGRPVARLCAVRVLEHFPLILNLSVTEELFLANWRHSAKSIAAVAAGGIVALLLAVFAVLRAIRQREKSAALVRDLTDQVPGMLFQFQVFPDGSACFPYVNRPFLDFYGLTQNDLPVDAKKIFAYQHPDDAAAVRASIEEATRTLRPWRQDYRLVMPGQGVVWRHGAAKPQKLKDGSVLWHGYIADISEIKATEQDLKKSLSVLTATLEATDDAILVVDMNQHWVMYNRKFLALWKIPDDIAAAEDDAVALGYVLDQLVDPQAFVDKVGALYATPEASSFDSFEFKDGKVIEHYSMPQMIDGKVAGRVWSFRDITARKRAEQQVAESLNRLSKIAERVPGMVFQFRQRFDGTYSIPFASGAVRDIFHASPDEVCSDVSRIFDRVVPEDFERVMASIRQSALDMSPWTCEFRVRIGAAPPRWLLGSSMPEREADGGVLWHGFVTDITERKEEEEKLLLAASVFSHSREGIMITAADGTIIDVNDAFTRITGYGRDEVLGRNPHILSSGRHAPEYYEAMWRGLREKGHWYGEIWNRRKDGEVYAEMQTVSAVLDDTGAVRNYVALFSDITAHKEHQRQLEHIAHYDALTSLPNRVLLADRLHQAMVRSQRSEQLVGVAYLDLDGFKAINDVHGHEAGDQLLMTVAARMRQSLREGDTLARLGGDEFVAVLIDLEDTKASVVMLTRLLAAAAQPVHIGGDIVLQVSASVGVTYYPQAEDVDADQLLRQADQAMYQAKLAGRNRFHLFDAEHDRSVRSHRESLESIRRALVNGEFVLHYQPKVNMRSGELIGAEALIRWPHPEKGLLLPIAFLPVIEDHPLAIEVGEWVIDSALRQVQRWRSAGLDVPVSVNVGAYQLQRPDFAERMRSLLAAHPQASASDLEIEVLETSALEDLAQTSMVIDTCGEMGVRFALDDFGTGYSSLTYLKRLSVAQLKIDQSFVRNMLSDPEDLTILEGVLGMATAFRRQVIAEGVETVAHGKLLLQLGCEYAQGHGIARPMPADEFMPWAASWRPDPIWSEQRRVSRDDLPLLFAGVEHRAWIVAMGEYLTNVRDALPVLDEQKCRFGLWLAAEGRIRYGGHPTLPAVESLHRQVHALAADLQQRPERGRDPNVQAGLVRLHALRDGLLAQLEALLR